MKTVLICYGFGNMAYMLFCGLPCLRSKEHKSREGFHTAFEGKEGRVRIKTGREVNINDNPKNHR
jgi:hypothetical protein